MPSPQDLANHRLWLDHSNTKQLLEALKRQQSEALLTAMRLPQHNSSTDFTKQILDSVKLSHVLNNIIESISNGNYLDQSPVLSPLNPGSQRTSVQSPVTGVEQPVQQPAVQPVVRPARQPLPATGFVEIAGRSEFLGTGE